MKSGKETIRKLEDVFRMGYEKGYADGAERGYTEKADPKHPYAMDFLYYDMAVHELKLNQLVDQVLRGHYKYAPVAEIDEKTEGISLFNYKGRWKVIETREHPTRGRMFLTTDGAFYIPIDDMLNEVSERAWREADGSKARQ